MYDDNETDQQTQWKESRAFFMTPQTVVNGMNDGAIDPGEICLVIFGGSSFLIMVRLPAVSADSTRRFLDEAHRGTGEYSYAQLMHQLTQRGSRFRVLAMTATPGNTVSAVQAVVDALHIECLEIRGEDHPDVAPYTNVKVSFTRRARVLRCPGAETGYDAC